MVYQIYRKNDAGIYTVYNRSHFTDIAFTTAYALHRHWGLDVFVWDTYTDCIYNYLGEPYPGVFTLSRRIRPEGMEMPRSQPDPIVRDRDGFAEKLLADYNWVDGPMATPVPDVHTDRRPCTCSPDSRPPTCMRKYALTDCSAAFATALVSKPASAKFVRLVPRMEEEKPYEEVAPAHGTYGTHISFGSMEELMAEGDRMYENYRKADWPENVPPPPPDRRIVREWPLDVSVEELLSLEADSPDESSHRLRMMAYRNNRLVALRQRTQEGLSWRAKWYNRFIRWVLRQP